MYFVPYRCTSCDGIVFFDENRLGGINNYEGWDMVWCPYCSYYMDDAIKFFVPTVFSFGPSDHIEAGNSGFIDGYNGNVTIHKG